MPAKCSEFQVAHLRFSHILSGRWLRIAVQKDTVRLNLTTYINERVPILRVESFFFLNLTHIVPRGGRRGYSTCSMRKRLFSPRLLKIWETNSGRFLHPHRPSAAVNLVHVLTHTANCLPASSVRSRYNPSQLAATPCVRLFPGDFDDALRGIVSGKRQNFPTDEGRGGGAGIVLFF